MAERSLNRRPIYVLSARGRLAIPAQGCVNEFEDVLADMLGAAIVSPSSAQESAAFVDQVPSGADLFVVCLSVSQLVETLKRAKGWRRRFNRVCGYVFDSALPKSELQRSAFRRRFASFSRTVSALDHLFVSSRPAVEMVARCYAIPVSYVPLAADVKKFGSMQPSRPITVNGYGRQHPEHLKALADAYNHNQSGRSLYYTSHMSGITMDDWLGHRAFFWKMLSMSRIGLAYDIVRVGGGRGLPYSIVGQRWFESLAAGCAVVGYRPHCVEADELLHWQDATIEGPDDPGEFVAFIEGLLSDHGRLDAVRASNYRNMASAHDWGHRVETMMQTLKIEPTGALRQRLLDLERLACPTPAEGSAA